MLIFYRTYNAICIYNAPVAQWIEHPPPKGRVTRSIRVRGTKGIQQSKIN